MNVRRALSLVCLLSLGGCAGYASDYWRPKAHLISPQLARYGMSGKQSLCMEEKLTAALGVKPLRQLSDLAARLQPGGNNPTSFAPWDFAYVAGLVRNPEVGVETRKALQACGLPVTAPPPAPPPLPPSANPAAPAAPALVPGAPLPTGGDRPPLWVNLGVAPTGQGIAVDVSSLVNGAGYREAWFRLLNGDRASVGDLGYRLRIDCAAHTITALAGRKYAPGGALVEQKEYAKPEGPMPMEKGTVLEIAFRGVCT